MAHVPDELAAKAADEGKGAGFPGGRQMATGPRLLVQKSGHHAAESAPPAPAAAVTGPAGTDTRNGGFDEASPESSRRCPEHLRRREACARSLELARIAQGLSQQRAANSARVSRAQWQKYEAGEHALDPAAVECSPALARTFYALRLAAIEGAPPGPPVESSLPTLVQVVGQIAKILEDGQITFDEVEGTREAGAALQDIGQRLILAAQATFDRERGR